MVHISLCNKNIAKSSRIVIIHSSNSLQTCKFIEYVSAQPWPPIVFHCLECWESTLTHCCGHGKDFQTISNSWLMCMNLFLWSSWKSVHRPQIWTVGAVQVLLNPPTLPVFLEDCIHFFPAQDESVGRVWWCDDCHTLWNPLGSLAIRRCWKHGQLQADLDRKGQTAVWGTSSCSEELSFSRLQAFHPNCQPVAPPGKLPPEPPSKMHQGVALVKTALLWERDMSSPEPDGRHSMSWMLWLQF